MDGFELVALPGGLHSLRARENGQTFHPVIGPVAEAEAVHVRGTRLVERVGVLPPGGEFVLWDVGLGAAANAVTAIRALQDNPRGPGGGVVTLVSFDRNTAALEFALANAAALEYPLGCEPALHALLEHHAAQVQIHDATLNWQAVLDDFPTVLAGTNELPTPHAVFYDPYSPTVNPEMWTLETFSALYARLRTDTPCSLTTYTRSTAVRVTLLLAGFFVGVGGATGEKDETTVAANAPALLERPLGRGWLEKKVHASTNAAPLRAGPGDVRGPIPEADFEALRAHPQFAGNA